MSSSNIEKEKPSESSQVRDSPDSEGVKYGEIEIVHHNNHDIRRDIGLLRIIAIGFNVPNSWFTIAASFSIAIAAGGPVSLIYGTIVSAVFYTCAAVTLAELASVYPTAGGQYHFASILAPEKYNRGIAYTCGAISTLSWIINATGGAVLGAQLITALPQFYNGYEAKQWQTFLITQAVNFFALVYNPFLLKRTNWLHEVAFYLTLSTFIVSTITCLARSEKASSSWVWTTFETNSGWSGGISFLTGLTTPCYMYGGLDAALHLAEETKNAARTVPKALMSTIVIGFFTGFTFSVAMTYCIVDLDSLLNDPMPIYKLWRVATRSDIAGTVFVIMLAIIIVFILIAIQQTSSRLIWAFACDRGLFWSEHISKLSKPLGDIPVYALIFNTVWVFLGGCLYLASTSAFNALVNTFLLMQMVSFAMPAALLIYQKRSSRFLPRDRPFRVPEFFGWFCNIGTVVAAIIETVFFCFPAALPVSTGSMNYAVVVLAIIALFSGLNWVVYARKNYQGPRIELCK